MKESTGIHKGLRRISPVVALLFAGSLTLCAQTQTNDQQFAKEAAAGGHAEVELGQLAQTNGKSESVKSFGQRMVTDHTKADNDLKNTAKKDDIQLPQALSSADRATYDRLAKLQGGEFDRAYARTMVQDHRKDIAAFEKEASSGADTSIKDFAQRTLPTLKSHLRAAEKMEKTVAG